MKNHFTILLLFLTAIVVQSQTIKSPDGNLSLSVSLENGKPFYCIKFNETVVLENSPFGLITNMGNFSKNLKISGSEEHKIYKEYKQEKIKQSNIKYTANELKLTLTNSDHKSIEAVFRVSNNNIGFRYNLNQIDETAAVIIEKETTGFNFPANTTTFLSPQAKPGTGYKGTKPSYEEEYVPDEPLATPSKQGEGYTFPSLFRVEKNNWVLVSETGVSSQYCGSHLSDATKDGLYSITFPNAAENNGSGSVSPILALPCSTPWRTITVGNSLKPIVETTIPFDLVDPLYTASVNYKFGRSTWSWIMWQDESMNYEDQKTYIDLASQLGYEYILMDALWDKNIGYDKMKTLIDYAHSKKVDVFLWYNSNGYWNNAPQSPKNKLDTSIARKKEMKWLSEMGVKGLKVDFFGGDKQETMKLYEDILTDANEYGLMIIFHGCTLPRGWERMYPNYVGSEAVLASENLIFTQHANDMEAFNATLHPFIRNAVGSMEFGPVLLNKRRNRTNDGGQYRRTTEIFELATGIIFQNPVQMFALTPNNLTEVPLFEIDFMKAIPTTWDETLFIDGYPGKYCVIARRHDNKWYIAAINATKEKLVLNVKLPMLAGKKAIYYSDDKAMNAFKKEIVIDKTGKLELAIQPNGGTILTDF